MPQQPFEAFEREPANLPLIVVDIGYSSKRKSCGLAWTGAPSGINLEFGQAVEEIRKLLDHLANPVLVLEAALSTFHRHSGNPDYRGSFEEGRGWYWGSGAVSLIAAQRLLRQLTKDPGLESPVLLAEAFLSNKMRRTEHKSDAGVILRQFWHTQPEALSDGLEPASNLIRGIPSIRVFQV
jgi:hypothetical protein